MSWRRHLLCLVTFPQIAAKHTGTTGTLTTAQACCASFGCHGYAATQECQCNAECESYSNCCSDFQAVCLPSGADKNLSASCADYGCGDYSSSQECQCDVDCEFFGNCCSDYQAECTVEVRMAMEGSCVIFGCDSVRNPYNNCQCNSECVQEQTCCVDFEDVCGSGEDGKTPDKSAKKPGEGVDWDRCNTHFEPPSPGETVMDLNGVQLPDTCIPSKDEHRVFIIGDWGGLDSGDPEKGPVPADHRKEGVHKRDWVDGLDDQAQLRVRDQMREGAAKLHPDYIINVGDNFYWGGVEDQCGATRLNMSNFSTQWDGIFEDVYTGDGIDGLQWLGVLGNHDYGGFSYSNAWDQAILYTWKNPRGGKPGRWVTPALYWRSTVHYRDFSVEYFFLDSNVFDALDPFTKMNTNICSFAHNPHKYGETDCSSEAGPTGIFDCKIWFDQLWQEQLEWLHLHLSNSSADWQIVVTHFPPVFAPVLFRNLSDDYGIDVFLTGHLHRQEVHGNDDTNFLAPTVWIVSGGGGGITSDFPPDISGDSQYGYMIMTLTKDSIEIVNIDHAGNEGARAVASPRSCRNCSVEHVQRNLQRYDDGLEARGKLAHRTVTTTTTATETTTATGTTTSSTMPAVQEPFDWRVVVLFASISAVALLGGLIMKFYQSPVDRLRWIHGNLPLWIQSYLPSRSLRNPPAGALTQGDVAKQSLITAGWAQTELVAIEASDFF